MEAHLRIHHKDVCGDWNEYCKRYLNQDDEPTEEEKVYSDNLRDIVKVKCGHCGMKIQNNLRHQHMSDLHSGQLKNFKYIQKVYHRYGWNYLHIKIPLFNYFNFNFFHRCKICSKEFLFCPKNMREHLRLRHRDVCWDWEEYCRMYLSYYDSTDEEGFKDEIKMDVTDDQEDDTDEPKEEEEEDRKYSDDLKDIVSVKCGNCGIKIQNQSRLQHMREVHPGLSRVFQYLKKVYHRYVCIYCLINHWLTFIYTFNFL